MRSNTLAQVFNLQCSYKEITKSSYKQAADLNNRNELSTCLYEADVLRVLPEALTAHVESIFTDETVSVRANSAVERRKKTMLAKLGHSTGRGS